MRLIDEWLELSIGYYCALHLKYLSNEVDAGPALFSQGGLFFCRGPENLLKAGNYMLAAVDFCR